MFSDSYKKRDIFFSNRIKKNVFIPNTTETEYLLLSANIRNIEAGLLCGNIVLLI